jgi:hypothetical protein
MYMALATRPDISFAVAVLCRYNSPLFTRHLTTTKRVLQYLKSPADLPLHFCTTGSNDELTGYMDSDRANHSDVRKSPGGHVFRYSNGAVSWQRRKRDLIYMLSLEAEYIACSNGSRAVKWLLQLHQDTEGNDISPLPINCDNHGALSNLTTGITKARTKSIEVCYCNNQDLHSRKIVANSVLHTNENVTDILMMALKKEKHQKFT